MTSPPKESFQKSIDQLRSHIQGVHNTAVAIELAKQDGNTWFIVLTQ